MKKIFYLFIILVFNITYSQSESRYIKDEFFVDPHTNDYAYATVPALTTPYTSEMSVHYGNLILRIFMPLDDTLKNRPMLVCFHSGGFVSGSLDNDDMIEFCRTFARKGYVTATVDYRLGMNFWSSLSSERAVYRAIQDSRACLRYLRENAGLLRISPNHIYTLGSSAGAFIVLHNLFLDKENERPIGSFEIKNSQTPTDNGPDLGNLDAMGSYFNQSSKSNGIISLWGAISDTAIIEANDSQIPVFLVHGTADQSVPFGYGHPFGLTTLPNTYGSELIDKRLTNLNYPHKTYFVPDKYHEFYGVSNGMWSPVPNQYWDSVVSKVRNFLFEIHRPLSDFTYTQNSNTIQFINNSSNAVKWLWDFGDGQTSTDKDPIHKYNQIGKYDVTLTAYSEVLSETSKSTEINITTVRVDELSKLQSEIILYQNYPNPFKDRTTIRFYLPYNDYVSLKIYDYLGNEITILINDYLREGYNIIDFNSMNIESGIYIYELRTNNSIKRKKMLIVK